MPKVFEEAGFTGRFYMADLHEPVHIHVTKDGKEAKFWFYRSLVRIAEDYPAETCAGRKSWFKNIELTF
jgi:hypothetical protein